MRRARSLEPTDALDNGVQVKASNDDLFRQWHVVPSYLELAIRRLRLLQGWSRFPEQNVHRFLMNFWFSKI